MLDRHLVEDVANRLSTDAGLVEKDWHVVRAIGILAAIDHADIKPAFSGGTSLSKGWHLIQRFSEDIDFKISIPRAASKSKDRARRHDYRVLVLSALQDSGFELAGDVLKGNEGRFFSANLIYPAVFVTASGLRPHLRVEMTMEAPALPPVDRSIRSLIAELQGTAPEVTAFPCVDAIETAADKLSALAWRVCTRQRGGDSDDATVIRHLHDLGALENHVAAVPAFADMVRAAAIADTGRGGGSVPEAAAGRFAMMLDRLNSEPFWALEYDEYVRQVSFAPSGTTIGFEAALQSVDRMTALIRTGSGTRTNLMKETDGE